MQQAEQARKLEQDRNRRTATLLEYYRGHQNEYGLLHGAMCIAHPFNFPSEDFTLVDSLFDNLSIAARLDEIRAKGRLPA